MDMLLVILKVKKFLEHFTKKTQQKTNQKEFRVEKVIKRKSDMLNGKVMIIHLIVGYIKNTYYN